MLLVFFLLFLKVVLSDPQFSQGVVFFLLSCQHLTAVCMHIFSFTYTFSWHMHAHKHRHTCLSHARTHTRSNAAVVTGFCSSFSPWATSEKSSLERVSSGFGGTLFCNLEWQERVKRNRLFGVVLRKKVCQVVKMRWFFVVFDRSSSHRKRRGRPWSAPAWRLFPGNIHDFSMAIR